MVLQEIRRIPHKMKLRQEFELAKQQKIDEYNQKLNKGDNEVDRTLIQVQEDLLRLFGKLKVKYYKNS